MKQTLLDFRALFVALMCFVSSGAFAGADLPVEGKTYRLRNICAASYLTMEEDNDADIVLKETRVNSLLQMWTVERKGSNYDIRNAGNGMYISCLNLVKNAPVNAGPEPTHFSLQAANYSNWDCFNIVPSGSSLSLCSDMAGSKFVLYTKTDNGAYWVFEEAELLVPSIVTLKSVRSGQYIEENESNLLVQGAAVKETSKWIRYETEEGVALINSSTHNCIQIPVKNAQVTTAADPVYFETYEADFAWVFGYGGIFLNESNGKVVGWNQSFGDKGSQWVVDKVGEITEEEVIQILGGESPYERTLTDGLCFRIWNEALDKYLVDDYYALRVFGKDLDEKDLTQVWKAVAVGKEAFYLQNLATGRYLKSTANFNDDVMMSMNPETEYEPQVNTIFGKIKPYMNFISAGGLCPSIIGNNSIYNSYPGSKELSGAEWLVCRVDKIDEDDLKAARDDFEAFMSNYTIYEDMLNNEAAISDLLAQIFTDDACTSLIFGVSLLDDAEFAAKIAPLPKMLQDMCLKIRNNTWPKTLGGRSLDKKFRIATYQAYSNAQGMADELGMSHPFSRLSNPTGISAAAGEVVCVLVDDDCPDNATLKLEIVPNGEREEVMIGEQRPLQRGVNFFIVGKPSDLFITYEIDKADNNPAYYLDKFDKIKIHIEGGVTNGYFDLTKKMTDAEWADMVASGMLRDGRVYLKGDRVICNWPASKLLAENSETITDLATFYNNIPTWIQETMGINDIYMPGITKRYNNVFQATSTPGSVYMFASTYGTYYSWPTLGDILSKRVLTNGGLQWGPSHEFGHNHQRLFNMIGCTEVSNNAFANICIYKFGAAMSRGVGLSSLIPDYAAGTHWVDHNIWCQTQMYWKLYQFFHLAGYDTEFYPKVFALMRRNPMKGTIGRLTDATEDYLHFAEICCEAADADLSDFFRMYGFFEPLTTNSNFEDGTPCRLIDDYGYYYLRGTQGMIDATLEKCHSYERKYPNIGFIDDRIRQTPATYPGAPEGTMRSALNGGGANGIGSEGVLGMYLDYMPENYLKASGYTLKSLTFSANQLKVNINNDGQGAVGFKVYDSADNLLYFYNNFSFTVPASVHSRHTYKKDNIIILAADALGNDQVVYEGENYTGSMHDGVAAARAAVAPAAVYDLQGRRVSGHGHGLFIVDGKKVMK